MEPDPIMSFWRKWKIWIIIGGCLLALAALFAAFQWGSNWWFWRGVEKDKQEIKDTIANIKAKEESISNLQIEIAVEKERVREKTAEYANAVNASEQARAETNQALANLYDASTRKAFNVSVEDLERKLDALEKSK